MCNFKESGWPVLLNSNNTSPPIVVSVILSVSHLNNAFCPCYGKFDAQSGGAGELANYLKNKPAFYCGI